MCFLLTAPPSFKPALIRSQVMILTYMHFNLTLQQGMQKDEVHPLSCAPYAQMCQLSGS